MINKVNILLDESFVHCVKIHSIGSFSFTGFDPLCSVYC